MTVPQINQIKQITCWTPIKFHGNTKKVGTLDVELFKNIVQKKLKREYLKANNPKESDAQKVIRLAKYNLSVKGSNYFKIMIEGNTGIYLAHPIHSHSDYNKCRLFDKNEKTLKLMELYNKIVNR
jgi:hypothetical protein